MTKIFLPRDKDSFLSAAINVDVYLAEVVDWVASNCNPEEVFSEDDLQDWAESNGYTKVKP